MPIVVRDVTVVTSDAARTVHHDAAIVVDADRIVAIGPTEELDRHYPSAERVDGRGKAVFPGLVNCHTHLWLTVARGIQEDFGFPSTLRFPTTVQAMLSPEENAVFAMLGALECLRGGNTTLPGEISHLCRSRASVSHNAAMAARRAAAPPIQALAAAGCNIAMGTDNMAHDMLEAMRTGLFVERISRQDGERPWPEDVLEWGTRNGAAALGLGADVGSLEIGKKADLVILDARRPHLVPALRIVSAWIHNGQAGDVESVMVDGRWLMRDRRVLTIDEGDVVTRAEEIGRRVWRQLVARYPNVPFPIRLPPPVSGVADTSR